VPSSSIVTSINFVRKCARVCTSMCEWLCVCVAVCVLYDNCRCFSICCVLCLAFPAWLYYSIENNETDERK